jgi:hypothetical protein
VNTFVKILTWKNKVIWFHQFQEFIYFVLVLLLSERLDALHLSIILAKLGVFAIKIFHEFQEMVCSSVQ